MFTKEQLINIGAENVAEIILCLSENRPDIQKQIGLMHTGIDSGRDEIERLTAEPFSTIKNKLASLTQYLGHLSETPGLADKVNEVRLLIKEDVLPKFPNKAIELLLNLLDNHENVFEQTDDCDEIVLSVYRQACDDLSRAYLYTNYSSDDVADFVYNRIMNDDYGVYKTIVSQFWDILTDNGVGLLKQKLENVLEQNATIDESTECAQQQLRYIADYQNDMDAYIRVCSLKGEPSPSDHLAIARRFNKHGRGFEAIQWLDSMYISDHDIFITDNRMKEKQALKIQALDLCGDYKAAQAIRLSWFETTLKPDAYSELLKHAEADSMESFKKIAIQKALDFPNPHVALTFLREIQEFEEAAKLVRLKLDTLDGSNNHILGPIADILCEIDPLAATLLYRKMIQSVLAGPNSRYDVYFSLAAEDLAACVSLSSEITDWQEFPNHQLYFEELSKQHEIKTDFWNKFTSELAEQMEL